MGKKPKLKPLPPHVAGGFIAGTERRLNPLLANQPPGSTVPRFIKSPAPTNQQQSHRNASSSDPLPSSNHKLSSSSSNHKPFTKEITVTSCHLGDMTSKLNLCLGSLLTVATFLIMLVGTCTLAAGIVVSLELHINSFPFGLGADIAQREGGHHVLRLLRIAGWSAVGSGALMVLVGFIGCTGAMSRVKREYKGLGKTFLIMFMVLVLISVVLTISASVVVFLLQGTIWEKIRSSMKGSLSDYEGEQSTHPVSFLWNSLQLKMECCGVDDYEDWRRNDKWRESHSNQSWPYICCQWPRRAHITLQQLDSQGVPPLSTAERDHCYKFINPQPNAIYERGCYQAVRHEVEQRLPVIIIVVSAIITVQLFAVIAAAILCRHQEHMFDFSMHSSAT